MFHEDARPAGCRNCLMPNSKVSEIERDVSRTFPAHQRFKGDPGATGRAELLKVLRALVVAEPSVGYCQGMNFLAATLLIHLGAAQDAFWLLLAILEGYHFHHLFTPGVPLLPLRIFQFAGTVRQCLPRLWRHLKEDGFSLDIFAHQCVLTLFAYSLEPELLGHVYDTFFLLGWKAVFRIGAGLLGTLEEQLLGLGREDISHFLSQCKRHVRLPGSGAGGSCAAAFRELLGFKVSRKSLEELEGAFQIYRLEVLLAQVALP
ncbi:unnamed protein product, partial [Polarella glacialis]